MNKAVFLDRDGVVNKEKGEYIYQLDKFELNDSLIPFLKEIEKKGYIFIIITNQGGVAKGIYTLSEVEALNKVIFNSLKKENITLAEVYACPHHPDYGKCLCRKPDSLMLEKAMARFNIDPKQSYFIGDAERDVLAGEKAGVNSIKVESNSNLFNIIDRIS